jgi:hypothetical protein
MLLAKSQIADNSTVFLPYIVAEHDVKTASIAALTVIRVVSEANSLLKQ